MGFSPPPVSGAGIESASLTVTTVEPDTRWVLSRKFTAIKVTVTVPVDFAVTVNTSPLAVVMSATLSLSQTYSIV